ncbi:Fc.00g079720.m01.CDS01 [Cosmosporella sp. VM-42]
MRFPLRAGAVRSPFQLISYRALSTTSRLCVKEKERPPYERGIKSRKEQHGGPRQPPYKSKVDTRSRANSVSQGHDPKSRLRLDFNGGKKYQGRHGLFRATVLHRFQDILKRFNGSQVSVAGVGEDELNRQATLFMDAIDQSFQLAEKNVTGRDRNPLFWNLRDAFILKDLKGLANEIQYSFQSFLIRQRFSKGLEESHKRLLDFRFPHEWFPATRALQRTIHVHVGPTNSGKTYNALKALENSKSGVYAGPLRLLATEVYQRLNANGKPCALLTGEEVRIPENTDRFFSSCTVEMTPLNERIDVAVIDEIQMISDPERGSAWTSALLGVQAKEVHVCGEDRAVNLIQSICASIGDKCIVHRYQRLSPLETMNTAIDNDYSKLQKGDAVVAFSRLSLHGLKRTIEAKTGRRCAIIYGALPPEVRVQQAALFNDPNNDYDFIVASDAIGMGLNLEIRRVVLESVTKYDGSQNRMLTHPEIKQIGGRAGRYRTAQNAVDAAAATEPGAAPAPAVEEKKMGYVTAMDRADLRNIRRAFQSDVEDLEEAFITPPAAAIERFSTYFPKDTPLSFILMRIRELASVGERYRLGINADVLEIADVIQDLPLTIFDRLTFCHLPVSRISKSSDVVRALARIVAENSNGDLLSIKEIPLEFLDIDRKDFDGSASDYLHKLETLHIAVNQYIWLSYRYSGTFRSQALAFHVRTLVGDKLISTLEKLDFTEQQLENKRKNKRLQARVHNKSKRAYGEGELEGVEQETDDEPIDEPDEWPARVATAQAFAAAATS